VTAPRVARDPKRLERLWRDRPQFAPQGGPAEATSAGPLTITGMRAWRIKEPASGRRYTVVRLETRGGVAGYGEGGPVKGIDLADARPRVLGRRAVENEYFRHIFAASPAIEAAVSNACLDILSRHGKAPLYQFLGGPTRFKARVLASPEGLEPAAFKAPLERALKQGMGLAHSLGRLPKFADWSEARKRDETMLTEWQIYRMFDGRKGAWSTFQFLVRERLVADGTGVAADGSIG